MAFIFPIFINFSDFIRAKKFQNYNTVAMCLKITEKVSFNIAVEASYVYVLSNGKCQKWSILASFWKPEAFGQTVLPDRSISNSIRQKLAKNIKIQKFKCDILGDFQTLWCCLMKICDIKIKINRLFIFEKCPIQKSRCRFSFKSFKRLSKKRAKADFLLAFFVRLDLVTLVIRS